MVGNWEAWVALEIIMVFSTSLILSFAATPGLIRLGYQLRVLDLPDNADKTDSPSGPRKIHLKAIPRLGGLGILIGFFLSNFIWEGLSPIAGILGASILLFVTGIIDDVRNLTPWTRLIVQITAASAAVFYGNLSLTTLAFSSDIIFSISHWQGFLLSVFVIVGAINSINLIDGLDGLAGGIVFIGIALLGFSHFLLTRDSHVLALISFPIMGSLLGFLRFNTYPASIFMGDGGSSWLGFMVGILMLFTLNLISIDPEASTLVTPNSKALVLAPFTSVILCLGIPVFDTLLVIISRLKRRQNPLRPDRNHFHHHLLRLGLTQSQSVVAIYFIALTTGICGIAPIAFPVYNLWWAPWLGLIAIPSIMILVSRSGRNDKVTIFSIILSHWPGVARVSPRLKKLLRYWEGANRYTIYLLIIVMPFFAGVAPRPLGIAAAYAAGIIFFTLFIPTRKMDFLQHFMITIAACVLLTAININYLTIQIGGRTYSVHGLYNATYIWLFVSTLFHIIVTFRRNYLHISPTDFLLVTVPLLLLLVPDPWNSEYRLGTISIKGLIFFMGMRTLVKRQFSILRRIKILLLAALAFIAAVSLLQLRLVYG